MQSAAQMPLQEVLQALSRTPVTQPQLRAALATTCARWHLVRGDSAEAIRHLGHALEMVPDLRPAMRLLFRIYLDRGDVRSAVMYLDQEIRATRHPREAAALYRERGQLVEAHFHDLGAAQQCYQAALKATPRDLAVLRSVERVSLARGDVFWLIANLESQLEILQDPAAVSGILHDLALLEARHKGDLQLAGDLLIAGLEPFGEHVVLATDLFRVAEAAGDAELMLRALEADAAARPPGNRALALARASVVLREQRERPAALQLLQAAAHAAPNNFSLWRNLEELAMATSRFDVAAEACIGQLKAVGDDEEPGTRAEMFYRLGKLALFRLDRPQDGLAAMRKALRLLPGHPMTMEDTGRFLNAGSMWSQQLELIKLEIASARAAGLTSEEVALAHLRSGQLMEERLGELDGARRAYEDATGADPRYRPPRDRLERILHQLSDAEGLKRFYATELEHATSPARQAFLLSVLGQLHSTDDDPQLAIKFLVGHLKLQPKRLSSIQLLARLLARAGRNKELLAITAQEVTLTQSPARKAKLLHRAGELALQLQNVERARELFEAALDAVDDHLPSLEALGNMLRRDKDHEARIALLRKELLYANDRTRQVGLQLEIATLLATKLDRKHEALTELESLLKRWPRHLPALHAAESMSSALGRQDTLLALLEQHIATVTGPRTRALLLHRAAGIRASSGDDEGAIRDLVRALDLWPQLGVARAQLLRLYEQLGRSRELQAFAEAGLTSERGADDRRAMALQLAELSPRPVVAIQYLGAVAEARPEDYVTQLRLAQACLEAGRPSRQAGALAAAADRFAEELDQPDPSLLALRYRAARAEEAAGNLDAADNAYAKLLDARPDDTLAQRGRQRIRARKREAHEGRSVEDFEARAETADNRAHRAALLTIAAELTERRLDLKGALKRIDRALLAHPDYTPALHTKARVLERIGGDDGLTAARETLEELAGKFAEPTRKAPALCRAGTIALRAGTQGEPNPEAWRLFAEALWADPDSPRAIRGLRRTRDAHGTEGAPSLGKPLRARLEHMREGGTLTVTILRELVRLGADVDGPGCAVELLELGMHSVSDDPRLYADLAQAHARLGRWTAVVDALEAALAREQSPERRAALCYYAGEAHERAGNEARAVEHYLAAGQSGFHPTHALLAADRLAEKIGALEHRVSALQLLVDAGDGQERIRSLRALAEIHRGPLGQPDRAVELMRELLLLRPTDVDVIAELRRLLDRLERPEEGVAVLLAGIAHHRAWLRSADGVDQGRLDAQPIGGLMRLFSAMGERTGVYLCACVLERLGADLVPTGHRPDDLVAEPWPLPKAQEGRPFDGLIGDLPASAALDLLREGVFYVADMRIGPPPSVDLSPSRSLPSNNAVVMVARTLAGAMGVPHPLLFLDEDLDDTVVAHLTPAPCLVVGRRIASAPAGAHARDAIGRALLRLSTGGDGLHRHAKPPELVALLHGLCSAVGVQIKLSEVAPDKAFLSSILEGMPSRDALEELHDVAAAFRDAAERFDVKSLRYSLTMAEDRAGAACAGDPRPALQRVFSAGMPLARGRMLVGYLLSDDHLNLRRTLGYHVEIGATARSASEGRG